MNALRYNPTPAVAVAQLVESRIVIPVVAGSNPVSHPIINELGNLRKRVS